MIAVARAIIVTLLFLLGLFAILLISGSIIIVLDEGITSDNNGNIVLLSVSVMILLLSVFGLIAILRMENRYIDTDDDGQGGDGLPASKAQMRLIAKKFRDIGEFYNPRTRLTRGEAREIIRSFNSDR